MKTNIDKLYSLVVARTDRKFDAYIEGNTGSWELSFGKNICFATPFYEGSVGVPVEVTSDDGILSHAFELPIATSEDLERIAAEYVRVCNLIPAIVGWE